MELPDEGGKFIEGLGGVRAIGAEIHPGAALEIGGEHVQDARGGIFRAVLLKNDRRFKAPGTPDELGGGPGVETELVYDY
jgi:hypothetical protein